MTEPNIKPLRRAATSGALNQSTNAQASGAVRHRVSSGQNGPHSISPRPGVDKRRASLLSYSSMDEAARSFSEDLLNPSMNRANSREDEEVTAWHSTPLAFAILPAIGGIFFKNGTAFVTDLLLLGLAAIFMNWSVRLPWDWYYSAQAQLREAETEEYPSAEEVEVDETAVESASSVDNSPKQQTAHLDEKPEVEPKVEPKVLATDANASRKLEAAAELRKQETLALIATFVFPVMAAYLLHAIRSQLSNTSTALVSDFNLSIFVLAAEIRPFQQLIRLLSSRTLHLQRIVTSDNDQAARNPNATKALESRISELENLLADRNSGAANGPTPQKSEVADMIATEVKKRSEPRFDALERAMRRYEKRSTTLSLLTEQRLNTLDSRIQESLSLAAAAAQRTQHRGAMGTLTDTIWTLVGLPLQLATDLALWPSRVLNLLYLKLRDFLYGRSRSRSSKAGSATASSNARDERTRAAQRRSVR